MLLHATLCWQRRRKIMDKLLKWYDEIFGLNIITYFMPFSVSREGSSCKMLFSKKSLLISGSRSGSSPINLENHLKHDSRSTVNTAFSAKQFQICLAWGAHSHNWPSCKRKNYKGLLSSASTMLFPARKLIFTLWCQYIFRLICDTPSSHKHTYTYTIVSNATLRAIAQQCFWRVPYFPYYNTKDFLFKNISYFHTIGAHKRNL